MVSSAAEPGRRLADVFPSLLNALDVEGQFGSESSSIHHSFNRVEAAVLVLVDGLGWSNLLQRKAHARYLMTQPRERIETVRPSTTGAALTSLLTGALPGEHGLIGYRIRDEASNTLRGTLTDWDDVTSDSGWLRAAPLMQAAATNNLNPVAIGRPAHANSGLTRALLKGARYRSAATIEDRFLAAAEEINSGGARLVYLYVDELDRAGHLHGWQNGAWADALEELDSQIAKLVSTLPSNAGCILTADHGMVDVPQHRHFLMDSEPGLLEGVQLIGGEPRLRYLYLESPSEHSRSNLAQMWRDSQAGMARVYTREEALNSGLFGHVDTVVAQRIGDLVIAATANVAYYTSAESDVQSRQMVGQHGSTSEDELGVPLIRLGGFAQR